MMWRNVWAVIRREYVQRVYSKAFVFGTLAVPLLLIVMIAVPAAIANGDDERHIAVVDRTGVLLDRLEPDLLELGWTVERMDGDADADALRRRAEEGQLLGFLVLDERTLTEGRATFETTSRPEPVRTFTLRAAINRAAMERLLEVGGGAESMLSGGELSVQLLSDAARGTDPDENGPQFLVAFFGAFVLYMVILIYSVAVLRATLEEKTSRIVEVIVSSMKPWHLLLGKIIGVGSVSLTQLAIWLSAGALAAAAGIPTLVAARPDLTGLIDVQDALPGLGMLVLFVGYFLFGFFMYSGLYAAVGAICETDQDANQAQFPVMMFLIVPFFLVMPVMYDPTAPWAVAVSLFPLFSPILMWARLAAGGAAAWEVAASFVLMALAIVVIAWVAGRIYRVGMLMTGKRPTLPELWRWVRAG